MRLAFMLVVLLFGLMGPAFAHEKGSTVYDRVMTSGTIRCGWNTWYPILMKDPNTGEFSGIFYEFSEAMGDALGLPIEWVGPIGWGDFPAALQSGKIDAMCTGIWPNSRRARVMDFSSPLYYLPFVAVGRADDDRFDNDLQKLNDPQYALTMTDGESSSEMAYADFPKARKVELPQFSEISQNYLSVVNGKADAYLNDLVSYYEFNDKNPGQLKVIPSRRPVRTFANTFALLSGEDQFRRMINHAIDELNANGVLDRILDKYEKYPGSFYSVAKPYEKEEK